MPAKQKVRSYLENNLKEEGLGCGSGSRRAAQQAQGLKFKLLSYQENQNQNTFWGPSPVTYFSKRGSILYFLPHPNKAIRL
jgi:hypothetical protein